MAQPMSESEIQNLLADLQNESAKRRWATIGRIMKLKVEDERIAGMLETMAVQDPKDYVREEAQKAVGSPTYAAILQRQREEEQAKKAAEQAEREAIAQAQQSATFSPTQCPTCGFENPAGVKFCQNCGNSMTVKCRRCGTPNTLGVIFCGNCGVKLSEAKFGLPAEELKDWRAAFSEMGWFDQMGPKTKQLLSQLAPALGANYEYTIFVTYGNGRNYVKDVTVNGRDIHRQHFGVIGTDWRLIILDSDKMQIFDFPYGDLAGFDEDSHGAKERFYAVRTKTGHTFRLLVHLDAPGLLGFFAGFNDPVTAQNVVAHERRAADVMKFLSIYFARIMPN